VVTKSGSRVDGHDTAVFGRVSAGCYVQVYRPCRTRPQQAIIICPSRMKAAASTSPRDVTDSCPPGTPTAVYRRRKTHRRQNIVPDVASQRNSRGRRRPYVNPAAARHGEYRHFTLSRTFAARHNLIFSTNPMISRSCKPTVGRHRQRPVCTSRKTVQINCC